MALREPAGVILGIAPWNAPIILGVRAIAVPLACGNTVILKASEQCPRTHAPDRRGVRRGRLPRWRGQRRHQRAGGCRAIVGALIDHPAVRRINFTGSTAVGKIIAKRAAEHLKPVLLELGGKAPLIVLDDADLDEAVKAAAFGAFMNQGQICMSTERIIVVDASPTISSRASRRRSRRCRSATRARARPRSARWSMPRRSAHVQGLIDDAWRKGAVVPMAVRRMAC
jgi:benzaldehyde dehydrogenase (NAD)